MSALSQTLLVIHVASGFTALATGLLSMLNRKGGQNHRLTGKIFFTGMTGVFITAVALSVIRPNPFLFMVGFFSYYLACSGYRSLYLKKLHLSQKPKWIDWLISVTGTGFGTGLILFGLHWLELRGVWGFVPLSFGTFCLGTAVMDILKFYRPQPKTARLINHGSKMGGAFAATLTAFIVTNFEMGSLSWVLWILPGLVVGIWIKVKLRSFKAN
ncbi:MAG: hypothetical protein H7Y13_01690 [Sphingobacteriaceae bacterium]|nr:hypothetical protein [Sphingobacteriaceae bacterium]